VGAPGEPAPQRVTRDVALSAVQDLMDHPPRVTVAFVENDAVDLLPARARFSSEGYLFGVAAGAPHLQGREVVVVIDAGPYWFELRGISVRGLAGPVDPPAPERPGTVWYRIDPRRVLAWDYGAIREE
jgi:hypothetical protein